MVVRELLTRVGIKLDASSFSKADAATEKTASELTKLGAAAGAALAVMGLALRSFINHQVEAIDMIGKTATQLGVNTEALQELSFAADLAGVDFAQFSQGMALLQKNAKEAKDGSTEFAQEFKNLGINVVDANGELKDGPQLLSEMAEGLSKVTSASEKVGISQTLMGRSGRKMLPLFTEGAAGVKKLREEAQTLGFVLGEEDVRATEFLKDEMTRFERVTRGLKQQLFLGLLPVVTRLFGGLIAVGKSFSSVVRGGKLVEATLLVLGSVAAALGLVFVAAFAGPLLIILTVAAGVAALLLVVEEVLTLFDGGRSIIGLFIDEIFGLGAANEFVENHRAGVEFLKQTWEEAGGSVVDFFATLFGFAGDVQAFADGFENLGASIFEFLDRARIGLQNLLDSGVANVVKFIAKITGQDEVAAQIDAQLAQRVADRELGQQRTGRGMGGQAVATGLLGGNVERGRGIQQRLQERRERRRLQRVAREAGVNVEGLTAERSSRALGRGTGADVELTRFGVARAATAERRQAIELNQDNRNLITINAPNGDVKEIRRQLEASLAERDERNRRQANAAVTRTAK